MDISSSIVLGIVEGITEFLPISSTGHLILTSRLLGIFQTDFVKSYEIIIQLGAISAVILLYFRTLFRLETIKKLAIAFLPTGVIGLLFYQVVKTYLIGNTTVVLWSLLVGGIALIVFEYFHKEKINIEEGEGISAISYRQALLIGFFQSIAIVPGVSRSAATILGGLWLGLKRQTVVEFSFLLAVPTMLAASGLDIVKNYHLFSLEQLSILSIGFVTSFLVALGSIVFLLRYIKKHNFIAFGIYRIVLVVIFWFLIF